MQEALEKIGIKLVVGGRRPTWVAPYAEGAFSINHSCIWQEQKDDYLLAHEATHVAVAFGFLPKATMKVVKKQKQWNWGGVVLPPQFVKEVEKGLELSSWKYKEYMQEELPAYIGELFPTYIERVINSSGGETSVALLFSRLATEVDKL